MCHLKKKNNKLLLLLLHVYRYRSEHVAIFTLICDSSVILQHYGYILIVSSYNFLIRSVLELCLFG